MIRPKASSRRRRMPPEARPRPLPMDLMFLSGERTQAVEAGRTRLLVVSLLFALAFVTTGARVIDLSLLHEGNEPRLAQERQIEPLKTNRADIVDRNGIVLATTLPTASLYANPRQIIDAKAAARALAGVLPELDPESTAAKLRNGRSFVWLKRSLTPREQYRINRLGIPGLNFQREEQRVYPHGDLVSHVVGFTDVDNVGLAGLEKNFDDHLRGQGEPLVLSLDLRLQHILSEELSRAMDSFQGVGAAGLVLDARSGEVLALASLPSFDPRSPGTAAAEARFNRAALGIYEMGSIFKVFTTALALDSGVVTLADGYDASEPIRVSRYTIRDFKPKKRWLSIPEIFVYSSNIGTVQMALDTGTAAQRAFLGDLGLVRPAAIELPEVGAPMLPTPWREINTMTVSFGHGMAVSPVQLTSAVAAVVNGGRLRPATLIRQPDHGRVPGRRVISARTSETMRWLMREAVLEGTGRKADAHGYVVGGKTGTADKLRGGRYARDARIASFIGAFPMNDPRYVVFAMVDEPKGRKETFGYATGGWVCAPAVRRIVERMAPLVGMTPRPDFQEWEAGTELIIQASAKGTAFATE